MHRREANGRSLGIRLSEGGMLDLGLLWASPEVMENSVGECARGPTSSSCWLKLIAHELERV